MAVASPLEQPCAVVASTLVIFKLKAEVGSVIVAPIDVVQSLASVIVTLYAPAITFDKSWLVELLTSFQTYV